MNLPNILQSKQKSSNLFLQFTATISTNLPTSVHIFPFIPIILAQRPIPPFVLWIQKFLLSMAFIPVGPSQGLYSFIPHQFTDQVFKSLSCLQTSYHPIFTTQPPIHFSTDSNSSFILMTTIPQFTSDCLLLI